MTSGGGGRGVGSMPLAVTQEDFLVQMDLATSQGLASELCSKCWGFFDGPLVAIIANSDRQRRLEFDCNLEASLVRGERPLIDFH